MKQITEALSKQNTKCLKGVLSILIVLSHIRNNMMSLNDTIIGMGLTVIAYLSVGMFFFLSGYGLHSQYLNKDKYMDTFLKNRVLFTYLCYVFAIVFYTAVDLVVYGGVNLKVLIQSFFYGRTILAYGWFFQAIILLYLLYYVLYSYKKFVRNGFLFILLPYVIITLIFAGDPFLYLVSIIPFPIGIITAQYKEKINAIVERHYVKLLVFSIFIFIITVLLGNLDFLNPSLIRKVFKCLSTMAFVVTVVLLLCIVPIDTAITRVLGKFSLAIYVAQELPINILRSKYIYIESDLLYCISALVMCVPASWIFYSAFNAIERGVLKTGGGKWR